MSFNCIRLCSLLLRKHFGSIVEAVGKNLLENGAQPLGLIIRGAKINPFKVKQALAVLIQHNLVAFSEGSRGQVEYTINKERVLQIISYPRYIYVAKSLYGDAAELLIEEMLQHGQITMSAITTKVTEKLHDAMKDNMGLPGLVQERFALLVNLQFIQRCPLLDLTEGATDAPRIPTFLDNSKIMYCIPEVVAPGKRKRDDTEEEVGPSRKRTRTDGASEEDQEIYWMVNVDRFNQFLRDELIIQSVENRIDVTAGSVMRAFLKLASNDMDPWAPISLIVSRNELVKQVTKEAGLLPQLLDQYLTVIGSDPVGFITKVQESQGGQYIINMKNIITTLATTAVETVVEERFGSKAKRIFRLLLNKKYLEQKEIEQYAMISPKDAKEETYKMLETNFVQFKEIPKTPEYAAARMFFLFHVDLNKVSRMLVQNCYKAMSNLINRTDYEYDSNMRIQEKRAKIESILEEMRRLGNEDPQQIAEVEGALTPAECKQIDRLKAVAIKLDLSELQVDETRIVLETYLRYMVMKPAPPRGKQPDR